MMPNAYTEYPVAPGSFTWSEFSDGVPNRLLLPVDQFEWRVEFADVFLPQPARLEIANVLRQHVSDALRVEPVCELHSLTTRVNQTPDIDVEPDAGFQPSYVNLVFQNPVFHFSLQIGPNALVLKKLKSSLEDLIYTVAVFERIIAALLPTDSPDDGLNPLIPGANILRLNFELQTSFRLGARLSDESTQVRNTELLEKLLRLEVRGSKTDSQYRDNPLAGLGVERVLRSEVTLGFVKQIDNRPRQVWITTDAPNNLTGRDVIVSATYRLGEAESTLMQDDLHDFRIPFMSCFRDLLLRRYLADLLHDAAVTAR